MKIELAVSPPLFSGYHFYACPGVVAKRNPTADIWYYNNSVGLKTEFYPQWTGAEKSAWPKPIDTFLENADSRHIGILERDEAPAALALGCLQEFLADALRADRYLYYESIDEYYIPDTVSFLRDHFLHDGMITGIDTDKKLVSVMLYSQRRVFEKIWVPLIRLEQALSVSPQATFALLHCLQTPLCLDVGGMEVALQRYLTEQEPTVLERLGRRLYQYRGICAIDGWTAFLESAKNMDFTWRGPAFAVLCEHKKCMAKRLMALAKAKGSVGQMSTARRCFETVYQSMEYCRLLYFKAYCRADKSVYPKLQENLCAIKRVERECLQRFLEAST